MLGLGITSKAALTLTPILLGAVIAAGRMDLQPESKIWVDGTSTVRSFSCTAAVVEADIATTKPDAASAVFAGEKAIGTVAVRIPASRLDCRNGTMNGHMLKAIKAEASPTIAFNLKSYDLLETDDDVTTKMKGTLALGGTTRDIAIDAGLVQQPDGSLRVKGSYDLRLTEYGLKPPSLMLGSMKVGDLVKVNFDLLLKD